MGSAAGLRRQRECASGEGAQVRETRSYKRRCRGRSEPLPQSPSDTHNMTGLMRSIFGVNNPSTPPSKSNRSPSGGSGGSGGGGGDDDDSPPGQPPRSLDMVLKKLSENLVCLECAKHVLEGVRCQQDQVGPQQKSCARCRQKRSACILASGETLGYIKNLVRWHDDYLAGSTKYTLKDLQNIQHHVTTHVNNDKQAAASGIRRRSPTKPRTSNFLAGIAGPSDSQGRGSRASRPIVVGSEEEDSGLPLYKTASPRASSVLRRRAQEESPSPPSTFEGFSDIVEDEDYQGKGKGKAVDKGKGKSLAPSSSTRVPLFEKKKRGGSEE